MKPLNPLIFAVLIAVQTNINAATFTVTTTNDVGSGSLRQAMTDANSNAGPDVVQFDIPGAGVKSIMPGSALPPITDPVLLDRVRKATNGKEDQQGSTEGIG